MKDVMKAALRALLKIAVVAAGFELLLIMMILFTGKVPVRSFSELLIEIQRTELAVYGGIYVGCFTVLLAFALLAGGLKWLARLIRPKPNPDAR
jgi:hypothetical protein